MVRPVALAHVALLVVSAGTTAVLAGYAWRRRPEPGARPFIGLMVAVTVWTACYAAGLVTPHPQWRVVWEHAQWLGIPYVPLAFLLFALEYTGTDALVTRRGVAALLVVPVASTALAWTNGWHGLVWTETSIVVTDGLAFAVQSFGPWFWVNLLYTYVLLGVGGFLLLRLVLLSDLLYVDQAVLVAVGVVVPVVGNVLSVVGLTPYPGIDLVPYSLAVTGLAFGDALFRYRLFELVPATREVGRRAAIADLEDGVVIVDADRQVVYLNGAAADVFDCDPGEALGRPAASVVGPDALSLDADDGRGEFRRDGRTYAVRSSPIHDRHDRPLGHTMVVHDVTERERRERWLRRHRDELVLLDRINEVIREVNAALVGAATRADVERAVCTRLAGSELYRAAWLGRGVGSDRVEWTAAAGDPPGGWADRGGEPAAGSDDAAGDGSPAPSPEAVADLGVPLDATAVADHPPAESDVAVSDGDGAWTAVPVVYGRTVYATLVLFTDRPDAFGDRELAVLGELGGTIGHAIDAVERRRLLSATAVVEVELTCGGSVLAAAADRTGRRLDLEGVVPTGDGVVAYLSVDGPAGTVRDAVVDADGVARARVVDATARDGPAAGEEPAVDEGPAVGDADAVSDVPDDACETGGWVTDVVPGDGGPRDGDPESEGRDGGLVEVVLAGESMVVPLVARGANVVALSAEGGTSRVVAEVAPDADVRALVSAVRETVPDASLAAKRDRDRPAAVPDLPETAVAELSERQRQAIEAAYHAGYFSWPRESTGEEVAAAMDVSAPTFYNHLRKAQDKLLAATVDRDGE